MHPVPQPSGRSPLRVVRLVLEVTLLVVIGLGMSGVILGRVLPALGHPVFVVAGPSMAPAIGVGSAVILDPVSASDLRTGDVVSLRSGPQQAVFTHRIVRILDHQGAPWIETKGDANPAADPSITPVADVIGRVSIVLPVAGYALALLSSPIGVILILSVGATLMVATWLLQSMEDDRRRAAMRTVLATTPAVGPTMDARAPTAVVRPRGPRADRAALAREQRRLARARTSSRGV